MAEPAFFRVLKGDRWFVPSIGGAEDPAELAADNQPFDPSNPPTNRVLTPQEQQQVYIYQRKQREDQQKQEAASRRAEHGRGAARRRAGTAAAAAGAAWAVTPPCRSNWPRARA